MAGQVGQEGEVRDCRSKYTLAHVVKPKSAQGFALPGPSKAAPGLALRLGGDACWSSVPL